MKTVYVLTARGDETIQFYVGCTSDITRRYKEHSTNSRNPNHSEYNTYKYRFIRDLDSWGVHWTLDVLTTDIEVDEKTDEYSWIIKIARENEIKDHIFYDDKPLTNMKAGDFLEEMLADRQLSGSPKEVKKWLTKRKNKIDYNRGLPGRNAALFASVADETQERNRQERLTQIKKHKREIKRLEGVIENWKIIGFDYDRQEDAIIEEKAAMAELTKRNKK